MPPTVLCSTGPFYMLPVRQTLEAIAAAGYDGAEVMVTGEPDTQDGALLHAIGDDLGLTIPAIHAPFLVALLRVFTTNPLEKIKRSVGVAQAAGAPLIVVHPPFQWQRAFARWLKNDLDDFVLREDTTIAVENMFPLGMRGVGVPFYSATGIEHMKRYPFVVLDTSHLAVSGIDIMTALDEILDRLVHVHLSNNHGVGRDSHAPLTQGVLPIGTFLENLAAKEFAGTITLELDVRPWATDQAKLISFLKEQREYCLERLAAPAGA
ncbi:MAG: sugar phosphate isomerase/epimerase family protein [Actinomycetota bacterium]|nr:sugar phosphate isomerase/epimerase [Actinomycetota bacterium]